MANKFLDFIEFKYTDLTNQINNWLASYYNKSAIQFNSSSPYGQIVNVQKELFEHNMIYLKQATQLINIEESINEKVIKNCARIAGYNISRAISATGTLKFTMKNFNIDDKIKGGAFTLTDKLLMKNKSNGLNYCLDLGSDQMVVPVQTGTIFYAPIIQGKWDQSTITGNGKAGQSYTIQIPNNADIDNFKYTILYNGILLTVRDHLYDMLPLEWACVTKTAFNGGLDIYFGTGEYGFIPADGSTITVNYLLSNGTAGDILNPVNNDWKFLGTVQDLEGNDISLDKLFDITVETDIGFSSNGDSITSIKNNLPYVSRNFILEAPSQFIFHLSKLNMFSKINAFNMLEENDFSVSNTSVEDSINQLKSSISKGQSKAQINVKMDRFLQTYARNKNNTNDNQIYLYLIPDITKYFNNNINYFNVTFDVFYLDEDEQNKVLTYLNSAGILSMTTDIYIIQPTIIQYVMYIYIRRYSTSKEEDIRQQIIQAVSDYLIKNNRFDRIPKSDFVTLIKNITGIDSVDVYFVSKKNEDYYSKNVSLGLVVNDASLGLDPIHGDIVVGKDEYPIVRGGWKDRNGVYYNEDPMNFDGLNSINIIFDGVTETR